jgi:hypothetical protein
VEGVEDVGRVFVFSASDGAFISELVNPELDPSERFGNRSLVPLPHSIAVGAISDPVDGVENAGSVYLYEAQRAQ